MGEPLRDVLRQAPVMDVVSWSPPKKQVTLSFKDANQGHLGRLFMRSVDQVLVVGLDDAVFAVEDYVWLVRVCPRLCSPGLVRSFLLGGLGDLGVHAESDDYQSTLYFDREPRVDQFGGSHRGGVWWGTERRRDALGRWWNRSFRDLVTDDFGCLVSSQTGVAP